MSPGRSSRPETFRYARACAVAVESGRAGRAKWYAPRGRPALAAPAQSARNHGFTTVVPSVTLSDWVGAVASALIAMS